MAWHPLLETTLDIDERDADRAPEVISDRDLAAFGRSNRIALALGPVIDLGPSTDGTSTGYDVSLLCILHPHHRCHFRSTKLVVDLTATPGAMVRDMSPREVRGSAPVELTTKIADGFTFAIVPTVVGGDVLREHDHRRTIHRPTVLTSGRGFSRAMWDFRADQSNALELERELRLLLEAPPGVAVLARFNMRATIAFGDKGELLHLVRRTGEIDQSYQLSDPIVAVNR